MTNYKRQLNGKINELDYIYNPLSVDNNGLVEKLIDILRSQLAYTETLEARLCALEVFTGMTAPAPLPVASPDAEAPAVTFAAGDDKFEVAGWDEPTAEEVARFWSDEAAQERADVIREARYGKQL